MWKLFLDGVYTKIEIYFHSKLFCCLLIWIIPGPSVVGIYYANKIELLANPNAYNNERPFMMRLDSLNYHSAAVIYKNVMRWLNYEWNKRSGLEGDILTPSNFPIIRPKGKLDDVVMVHSFIVCHFFL